MNTQVAFRSQLIQYLIRTKSDDGFTLIELLIVIILMTVLSLIALPSFLNQSNKAKHSEAKHYISAMNKKQIIYYMENGSFTTNMEDLEMGTPSSTANYDYNVSIVDSRTIYNLGMPKDPSSKSYMGIVYINPQPVAFTLLCESKMPGAPAALPTTPACPSGSQLVE